MQSIAYSLIYSSAMLKYVELGGVSGYTSCAQIIILSLYSIFTHRKLRDDIP